MKRTIISLYGRLAVAALAFSGGKALAIDVSTGLLGSNIQVLRSAATQNPNETSQNRNLGWNLDGTGVNLGQIEGGRPGDPTLFNAAFTQQELFHSAINPGGVGVIGVAINGVTGVSGTDDNISLDPHSTSVAGMMVAQDAAERLGAALPNATLFSSTFVRVNRDATMVPPFNSTPERRWGANVVASGEWVRTQNGARGLPTIPTG